MGWDQHYLCHLPGSPAHRIVWQNQLASKEATAVACPGLKAAKPHLPEGRTPWPALTYLFGDLRSRRKERVTHDGEARPLCPATLPTSCRQCLLTLERPG